MQNDQLQNASGANIDAEEPILPAKGWAFTGPIPLKQAPYFELPFSLKHSIWYLYRAWRPFGLRFLMLLLATAIWVWFSPDLERSIRFQWDWVLEIALRNFVLVFILTVGLHLYLYTFRMQGGDTQYDSRLPTQVARKFTFGKQLWDNAFWTLASSTTVGTCWECLLRWAYANGHAEMISFAENPVWSVVLLLLIPIWSGLHFYATHRMLHIKPLYKWVHSYHHRNIVTGPLSGHAMHPLEHIILYSDVVIYFLLASHPIHMLFNLMLHTVAGPTSHAGFERVKFGKHFSIYIGDFMHQLHHRYVDCNYGSQETPWDKIFGSFHDGTANGDMTIRERRRTMNVE